MSDIKSIVIDGQTIYLPSSAEWEILERDKQFLGKPFGFFGESCLLAHVRERRVQFAQHDAIVFGFGLVRDYWWYYELLKLGGRLERVWFEDVWCFHCDKKSGISATPFSPDATLGISQDARRARHERIKQYPILCCIHCQKRLTRRNTVWLANSPTDV